MTASGSPRTWRVSASTRTSIGSPFSVRIRARASGTKTTRTLHREATACGSNRSSASAIRRSRSASITRTTSGAPEGSASFTSATVPSK